MMGGDNYNFSSRSFRASASGFHTKSADDIFTQSKVGKAHESMIPKGVIYRESRDSEVHPLTIPIEFNLDVTASMGHIPHDLVKEGLPKLMSKLIQKGVTDAALLLGGIGDHECDSYPLQIGQFESGDEQLDMWLTRLFLEGGGGANRGESYLLAHYFSAFHVRTDAWEKRKKKGFCITAGDEPPLTTLPLSALKEIMGKSAVGQSDYTIHELIKAAQERSHVYHINVIHGHRDASAPWTQLLGDNCINVTDYRTIPDVIADIVINNSDLQPVYEDAVSPTTDDKTSGGGGVAGTGSGIDTSGILL